MLLPCSTAAATAATVLPPPPPCCHTAAATLPKPLRDHRRRAAATAAVLPLSCRHHHCHHAAATAAATAKLLLPPPSCCRCCYLHCEIGLIMKKNSVRWQMWFLLTFWIIPTWRQIFAWGDAFNIWCLSLSVIKLYSSSIMSIESSGKINSERSELLL